MSVPEDDAQNALPPDQHGDGELIAGRYQIKELIGKGSTGAVYRAVDPVMSRSVAIKFLTLPFEQSELALKRFRQEAKLSSKLDHPNICRTLALGEEGQSAYIVAEWLEGKTLAQVINEERVLMAPRVISLATQLCDGLSAAHREGIVHRDIKPGNIFITTNPEGKEVAKIIDFGTALILRTDDERVSQKLTSTGCVLGTPAYMSPEQCVGKPTDERSDIYSLGCTIFEMVSGQLPFDGSSSYEVLSAHVNKTPPPVNQIASASEELGRIVTKAMMKEPEKRYQCAKELKSALSSLDTRQLQATITPPQTRKQHALLYTALTLVLLAGAAFAYKFFQQQQNETEQHQLASSTEAQARRWMEKGNYDAAALSWKKLARLQPENANHLIMLARCYNHLKQYDKTLTAARAAIELDSQNKAAYWERGLAEFNCGECLAGTANMNAYIEKPTPGLEDRRLLFAQIITPVFPRTAVHVIDKLLLEQKKSGSKATTVTSEAELRYFRGLAETQRLRFPEAEQDLLFVQRTNPDRPSLNANLALVEAQLGNADMAQSHLHADGSNIDSTLPSPVVMKIIEVLIAKHQDKNYRYDNGDVQSKAEMEFRDFAKQCDQELKTGNREAARVPATMAVNKAHLLSTALWKQKSTINDLARMISMSNQQSNNAGMLASNVFNYYLLAEQRLDSGPSPEHSREASDKLSIIKQACCKKAANLFCQRAEELANENQASAAIESLENFGIVRSKQNPFSFLALVKANELRALHGINDRTKEAANCYAIGTGYVRLGNYELAETNLAKAVALARKGNHNTLYLYLQLYGATLYKLKQYDLSIKHLKESLTASPKHPENPDWAAMAEASTHVLLAPAYRALKDNAAGDKEDRLAEQIVKDRFGIGSREYKAFMVSKANYLKNLPEVRPLHLQSSPIPPRSRAVPEDPTTANPPQQRDLLPK